jgi:dienelactone hydrolase
MKRLILSLVSVISMFCPAQDYETYGVEKVMPSSYKKMKSTLTFPMAWNNTSYRTFKEWKAAGKNILMKCLSPAPPRIDFNMKVIASEKRNGYIAEKITFNISDFDRVSGYLLIPDKHKKLCAAIVMLHDHGAKFSIGKEKMVRPLKFEENRILYEYGKQLDGKGQPILEKHRLIDESDKWVKACYDSVYVGDYFASKGYVVICTDALLWGERGRKEGSLYASQEALASNLQQMGYSWCGIMTYDDIATVDLLKQIPEVDKTRIGTLGFSMGGHRAWMLSACDDDIKAGAAVCWMNVTDELMTLENNQNKGGSSWSMIVPGLVNYMDIPDVASLACPKPMLFYSGAKDKLFPRAGVDKAYKQLNSIWKEQDASDKISTLISDGPHFFSKKMQQDVLIFFNDHLL